MKNSEWDKKVTTYNTKDGSIKNLIYANGKCEYPGPTVLEPSDAWFGTGFSNNKDPEFPYVKPL